MFKFKPPFSKFCLNLQVEYKRANLRHYKLVAIVRLGDPAMQDNRTFFNSFSHLSKAKVIKSINLVNCDMSETKRLKVALKLIKFQGKNLKGGDFVLESNNEKIMQNAHVFRYFYKQYVIAYGKQYHKDMESMRKLESIILLDDTHIIPVPIHRFNLKRIYIKLFSLDPKYLGIIKEKFQKQHVNILVSNCSSDILQSYTPINDKITSIEFSNVGPSATQTLFPMLPGLTKLQHLYINVNPGGHHFRKKEDFSFLKIMRTLDSLEDLEFCMNSESFTVSQHQDFWRNFRPPVHLRRLELLLTGDVFHPLLIEKDEDAISAKEELLSNFFNLLKLREFDLNVGGIKNIDRPINKLLVDLINTPKNLEKVMIKMAKGLNSQIASIEFPTIYDNFSLPDLKSIEFNLSEIGPAIDILPTSFPATYRIPVLKSLTQLSIIANRATNYKTILNLLDALPMKMKKIKLSLKEKIEIELWEAFVEKCLKFSALENFEIEGTKLTVSTQPKIENLLGTLIMTLKYLESIIVTLKIAQAFATSHQNRIKDAILYHKSIKYVGINLGYFTLESSFMHNGIYKPLYDEDEYFV